MSEPGLGGGVRRGSLELLGKFIPTYQKNHCKRGVEFKGGSLHDVLTVLESTLPSLCLSYKIQHHKATVAVSAVMEVSVMTATPLKLNPPFP